MFLENKVQLVRRANNLATICQLILTFQNPIGLHGLLWDSFLEDKQKRLLAMSQ
jgi:hypothetical protein